MGRLAERRFSTAKTIQPRPFRWKFSWPSGRTVRPPKSGKDEDSFIALHAKVRRDGDVRVLAMVRQRDQIQSPVAECERQGGLLPIAQLPTPNTATLAWPRP